jgi:hypothetical protein
MGSFIVVSLDFMLLEGLYAAQAFQGMGEGDAEWVGRGGFVLYIDIVFY